MYSLCQNATNGCLCIFECALVILTSGGSSGGIWYAGRCSGLSDVHIRAGAIQLCNLWCYSYGISSFVFKFVIHRHLAILV